jgi:hypothetical protein
MFSLDAGACLCEFQLTRLAAAGGRDVGLPLAGAHRVPGGAPRALCFAPPMPYWANAANETLLLLAGGRKQIHGHQGRGIALAPASQLHPSLPCCMPMAPRPAPSPPACAHQGRTTRSGSTTLTTGWRAPRSSARRTADP